MQARLLVNSLIGLRRDPLRNLRLIIDPSFILEMVGQTLPDLRTNKLTRVPNDCFDSTVKFESTLSLVLDEFKDLMQQYPEKATAATVELKRRMSDLSASGHILHPGMVELRNQFKSALSDLIDLTVDGKSTPFEGIGFVWACSRMALSCLEDRKNEVEKRIRAYLEFMKNPPQGVPMMLSRLLHMYMCRFHSSGNGMGTTKDHVDAALLDRLIFGWNGFPVIGISNDDGDKILARVESVESCMKQLIGVIPRPSSSGVLVSLHLSRAKIYPLYRSQSL